MLVDAAQSSDEMVFKCANGTFGCIASVQVGRDKLEIDVGVAKKRLEGGGTLVVQTMELGA